MRQRRCQFPLAEMGPVLGVVLRKARLASGAADSARRYPALAQRTLFSSGSCRDHYDEQAPSDGPDHAADLRNHLRASRVANQREYGRQQGKPDFRANSSSMMATSVLPVPMPMARRIARTPVANLSRQN